AWWGIADGSGRRQVGAYLSSLVSRYVPGGFAQPLHQVALAARSSEEVGESGVRLLQQQFLSVGCAGTLASAGALVLGSRTWLLIGVAAAAAGFMACSPSIIAWVWRVIRRNSILHPA